MAYLDQDEFLRDGAKGRLTNKADRDQVFNMNLKSREILPFLNAAHTFLPPVDAFDFILQLGSFEDSLVYSVASNILKQIADQVDLDSIIENFPPDDDSTKRAHILNCIPTPIRDQYFPFVFRAAASSSPVNRCAFLNLMNRTKGDTYPVHIMNSVKRIFELLSKDSSPFVTCCWIEPVLYYLRDSRLLTSQLSMIIHTNDVEIKVALATHFEEIYNITPEIMTLCHDKNQRVLAALIPSVAKSSLSEDKLKNLMDQPSHIVRILILRYFNKVPQYIINEYINDPSEELRIELIKYLCTLPAADCKKFALKVLNKPWKQVPNYYDWRHDYVFLCLPINILIEVGEPVFKLALEAAERRPLKLTKQAVYVLKQFAQAKNSYANEVNDLISKLSQKNYGYNARTVELFETDWDLSSS